MELIIIRFSETVLFHAVLSKNLELVKYLVSLNKIDLKAANKLIRNSVFYNIFKIKIVIKFINNIFTARYYILHVHWEI